MGGNTYAQRIVTNGPPLKLQEYNPQYKVWRLADYLFK